MDDSETMDGAADRLFAEVLAVSLGEATAAVLSGIASSPIHRRNPTIYPGGFAPPGPPTPSLAGAPQSPLRFERAAPLARA